MLAEDESAHSNHLVRVSRLRKRVAVENEHLKTEFLTLSAQLSSEQHALTTLHSRIAAHEAAIVSFSDRLDAVLADYADALQQSEAVSHANGTLAIVALNKVAEREKFTEVLTHIEAKCGALAALGGEYQAKIDAMQARLNESLAELQRAQDALQALDAKCRDRAEDVLETDKALEEVRAASVARQQSMQEVAAQIEEEQQKLSEVDVTRKMLLADTDRTLLAITQLNDAAEAARKEVIDVEKQVIAMDQDWRAKAEQVDR